MEPQERQKTFSERLRDAAVEEQKRASRRDRAVTNALNLGRKAYAREIVVIEDGDGVTSGAFVARVDHPGGTLWHALNNGERLSVTWYTRQLAVLHLLGVRYGDTDDSYGAGAQYAARVLGIVDSE